jgi:hypothetical protein
MPDNNTEAEASKSATSVAADIASIVEEPWRFHSGEKLNVSEASRVLNHRRAVVVFTAGASMSGKTTFLSRIGEMFRDGSFSSYRFARSQTLCAFERVSWLASIASEADKPDTPRTFRVENDTFFHLSVHPAGEMDREIDVLLSDLAGETFPTAVALQDFCAELRSLARADHLVVFLDSAELADPARRQAERNNAREFLSRVLAVVPHPRALQVHIVFSRHDYIRARGDKDVNEKFCEVIRHDFTRRFSDFFASLSFYNIAARPDIGAATNDEIQRLFSQWVDIPVSPIVANAVRIPAPARDFSAFGLR